MRRRTAKKPETILVLTPSQTQRKREPYHIRTKEPAYQDCLELPTSNPYNCEFHFNLQSIQEIKVLKYRMDQMETRES